MGGDRIYASIEPTPEADPDALEDDLRERFDATVHSRFSDGTLLLELYSGAEEAVVEALRGVGERIDRIAVVHVYDTTIVGTGEYFEVRDGDLVSVDAVEGSERNGIDVIDYLAREHDIHGYR